MREKNSIDENNKAVSKQQCAGNGSQLESKPTLNGRSRPPAIITRFPTNNLGGGQASSGSTSSVDTASLDQQEIMDMQGDGHCSLPPSVSTESLSSVSSVSSVSSPPSSIFLAPPPVSSRASVPFTSDPSGLVKRVYPLVRSFACENLLQLFPAQKKQIAEGEKKEDSKDCRRSPR